ncbi:hypothetical protein [Plantactinospora sp. WMMB782]|uniref:hypothetical protein n=1 Tax=Plantactinospora sp. WMMB782 TaxID=3404121 RepID=UPI003B958B2A
MRTLPSLPGCGQPATVRIEIYSPGPTGNAHGSLDGVAYGCGQHAGAIVQMIADAGLTPWHDPTPLDAADTSVCGRLRDFGAPVYPAGPADHNGEPAAELASTSQLPAEEPTDVGKLPTGDGSPASVAAFVARNKVPVPGPVQHPRWCTRGERDGRVHQSNRLATTPDGPDGRRFHVFLQEQYDLDVPEVVVQVDDPAGLVEYVLVLDVARSLTQGLRIAVSLAGMDR